MSRAVGIRGYGCYIPRSRLGVSAIGAAWGRVVPDPGAGGGRGGSGSGSAGERSVALHDEDALTMAVEAGAEALAGIEGKAVGAVYFASASAPYGEKQASDVLAAALDLRHEVATADFTGGTRAFTAALRAACDAVRAGSFRYVLVVASEMRQAEPGSGIEPLIGDAAAAVVVGAADGQAQGGPGGLVAEIEQIVSVSEEYAPVWRMAGDRFLRTDDEKVAAEAYVAGSLRAARRALEVAARDAADVSRIVAYAPDAGAYRALLKASGMGEKFHGRHLLGEVGCAGSAHLALVVCDALAGAAEGDRFLAIGWGGGADAVLVRAIGGPGSAGRPGVSREPGSTFQPASRRTLDDWLTSRIEISYQDYLRYRGLLATESGKLDPFASLTAERRDIRETLRLHGKRCEACGAVLYPVRPACRTCGSSGPFQDFRLGRRGTIVTWTRDHVYPGPGAPVSSVVVDLEGGGRLLTQMCEGEPAIGAPVELTLRRFHEGRGIPHYWWKARTPRGAALQAGASLAASGAEAPAASGAEAPAASGAEARP